MELTQIKSNQILVFVERGKPEYPCMLVPVLHVFLLHWQLEFFHILKVLIRV